MWIILFSTKYGVCRSLGGVVVKSKYFWLFVFMCILVFAIISCHSPDSARYTGLDLVPEPFYPGNSYSNPSDSYNSPSNDDYYYNNDYVPYYNQDDEIYYEPATEEYEPYPYLDPGVLDLQSETVFVAGRYAGILTWGYFHHSSYFYGYDSIIIAESSIIDTYTDTRLMLADVLDYRATDRALILLVEGILAQAPEAAPYLYTIEANWLSRIIMDHDGLRVLLAPDVTLWNLGFMSVLLPYESLDEAFLLGVELGLREPPRRPMVALTFDDGPSVYTDMILDLLEAVGGRATFCVLGNRVRHHPDTLVRAVALGNEVIGHSWDHRNLTNLGANGIANQITNTSAAIEAIIGHAPPPIMRAPYGLTNGRVVNVARDLGYSLLHWSVDPQDWANRDAEVIYYNIMKRVVDGSIVLLHDIHTTTAEAMVKVIPRLIEDGFQLVTASELIAYHYGELVPGHIYQGLRLPWGVTQHSLETSPYQYSPTYDMLEY